VAKARKLYEYFVFDGTNQNVIESYWATVASVGADTFSVDESGSLHVNAGWMPEKVIPVGGVFLPQTLEVYPTLADFQAEYEAV
jgi:hypothetical protein